MSTAGNLRDLLVQWDAPISQEILNVLTEEERLARRAELAQLRLDAEATIVAFENDATSTIGQARRTLIADAARVAIAGSVPGGFEPGDDV